MQRTNALLADERRCNPHISFCEGVDYGAFALLDQHPFIVLNIGLVPALLDFFQRMMSTAGLWPRIGNQTTLHPFEYRPEAENLRAHTLWRELPSRSPDDPIRQALGVLFMAECFALIVRHEFAHLVLGHVADEVQYAVKGDLLAIQALELAADGHAALFGLEAVYDIPRKFGKLQGPVDEAHRIFCSTPDDALLHYLLAIFFVFRLMDARQWHNYTLSARSHPPPPIRFHAVCIHLIERFQQNADIENERRVRFLIDDVWTIGEIVFAVTLGRTPRHDIKRITIGEETERHYNLLSEKAKTMPPHLFSATSSITTAS